MWFNDDRKFYKNAVNCAGIALINGGSIFLVRPFYDYKPQSYAIPKGHVERGEDKESAARREFSEETGIDISDKQVEFLCQVRTKIDDDTVKIVTVYVCDGDGDETFKGANLAENGSPENIFGEYIRYEDALQVITSYQRPIIEKLMGKEVESFSDFLDSKLEGIM